MRWIDVTRGVAIVLVVAGHAVQFMAPVGSDFFSNPVFATIYAFHMPLFAAISGYLFRPSLSRSGPSQAVRRRVATILVPYLAWTLVIALSRTLFDLRGKPAWNGIADAGDLVVQLLWQPGATVWFLWVIFLCGAIAALIGVQDRRVRWALLSAALALVYLLPFEEQLSLAQLRWLLPFFLLGFVANAKRRSLARFEGVATPIAVVAFVVLRIAWQRGDTVYLHKMRPDGSVAQALVRFGYRYAIALAGIVATIGLVRWICRRFELRVLAALGIASLGIYAVQSVLFLAVARSPKASEDFYYALSALFVAALVLGASFATTRLLERRSWTRAVLLGGR